MLSQIRQKKKKEAVRRLSQGSGITSALSHGSGQWPQRRKFSDQHRMQKQQPYEASQRPAKRSHVSPLHQDSADAVSSDTKPLKPDGTAGFRFGTAHLGVSRETTSFMHSATTSTTSTFSTAPRLGSVFSSSTGDANSSSSGSAVFGSTSATNTSTSGATLSTSTSSTSGNLFAPSMPGPQISSSSFAMPQASTLPFGSGFHKSTTSTDLVSSAASTSTGSPLKHGDSAKQPSSATLTFGSFPVFNSSASSSKDVSLGSGFGDVNTTKPVLTFGVTEQPSEARSINLSSPSKPLFPIMSQSASVFKTTKAIKPQPAGMFGQSLHSASQGHQAKENKEKITDKKIKTISTADLTALVIKEIPEMCNKNAWLKRFYSRFGEVTKVICAANKSCATVIFKTHEAAEAAKKKGRILRAGLPPVEIFWKQQGRRKSATSDSDQQSPDSNRAVVRSPDKSWKVLHRAMPTDEQGTKGNRRSGTVLRDIQDYLQTLASSETAGEKLQVLEGIDKKLRQVFKRSSDISSAKAVAGTCKDMCPEKERYMREYQRRLSVFESIPGTGSIDENPQVDHCRAIKEYDRSAADKEEPLPNELRPIPVLKMTMDYLATNIMDLVEGREGEWFDFVWNRTRGIRKDITQQHLCDPDCVDLVEKTARFHIICAHLLCEADMNSFDAKINTENLTKCLQTLKQFYGDLYKDKGVTCPQEAEFRAYDILLNLNEGDTLREAMTFRDEVQKSTEVRFAMDVFHALNSNNFVRFFRLLRNAKYLSACLLHRYFTQVRSRAIQTLSHSLSLQNRTTPFQLKELVDILAFEDESEAEEFCTYHGLSVKGGCVNFARSSFIEPETRFPMKRALKLIESKRNYSIGETVYNGPLPPPPQHQPRLSFDEDGCYIGDVGELVATLCKEDITSSQAAGQNNDGALAGNTPALSLPGRQQTIPGTSGRQVSITSAASSGGTDDASHSPILQTVHRPFTQPPQSQTKATVVYTAEEITHCTKSLFLEVLNEMCTELTKEALDKVHNCLELSSKIADELQEHTLIEFVRETATSVITDEKQNKRIAQENAATRERVSNAIRDYLTEEFVNRECAGIAEDVVREVREELLKIAREQATRKISLSLIDEGVLNELRDLAWDVLEEEKAERDAKLQLLAGQVMKRRTARYFQRWAKCFRTSVHLKSLLSTFPPGAPMLSAEEQLEYLVGNRRQGISMATIRTDVHERELSDALKERQIEMDRIREQACRPLDMPSLLADSIRAQLVAERSVHRSPIHWKLIISFPQGCDDVELTNGDRGRFMSFVIKEKFKRGMYPLPNSIPQGVKRKIDLLSLYRAEIRRFPTQSTTLKICAKACYGVLTNSEVREVLESRQFLGACAIIFVVDLRELQVNRQAARESSIRLRRLLESKPPEPRLPVAVIALGRDNTTLEEAYVFSSLGIQQLKSDGLLSECKVFHISSLAHPDDLSQTLCSAVTWLGGRTVISSLPKTDSLVDFIEDGLQREFMVPVSEDLFIRKQAKLEQQCPEAIIELFNSVLDHLGAVVSSRRLQRLSWPISEFNDKENLDQGVPHVTWNNEENLQKLCSCITALKLPLPPPAAADGTWDAESELCLKYARSLSPSSPGLINRVQWILDRAKRVLDEVNFLSTSPRLSASQVPWPLVLDACVNFRLTILHSSPGFVDQDVYYLKEELDTFVQPSLWRQSSEISKEEAARAGNTKRLELSRPRSNRDTKLHRSFLDTEQQLDEIRGTPQVNTTPAPLIPSPVALSSIVPLVTPSSVAPSLVTPYGENEHSGTASDSSIQATGEKLKAAVEQAKVESKRFDELLKNVLGDGESSTGLGANSWRKRKARSLGGTKKSPKILVGLDVPNIDLSFGSLEESLSCFNETLKSQRRSDALVERRLRQCLES